VKLPSNIEEVIVQSGRVRVRTSQDVFDSHLSLTQGRSLAQFIPVSETDLASDKIPLQLQFPVPEGYLAQTAKYGDSGEIVDPKTVCETGINTLPDWTLANGKTIHIMLFERHRPAEVTLHGTLVLAPHRRVLFFRAAVAAHRATATFKLTIRSASKTETKTVEINALHQGGRFRSGYQDVTLEIPPSAEEALLTMSVIYHAYRPSPEDNAPFLFIADPEVTMGQQTQQMVVPIHAHGTPKHVNRPKTSWYEAQVPAPVLSSCSAIQIEAGRETFTVFKPVEDTVHLADTNDHSLRVYASRAGRYAIYVDGEDAFLVHIGLNPTEIYLPTQYMTGGHHHISVRDASGTQTFLETYLLLPRILTPEDVLQRNSKSPFPGALSAQAEHRYGALKAQLANPGTPDQLVQLAYALGVLEGGYDNVKLKPLTFPEVKTPDVSIVIPAHNKVEVTYYTLCALLLAPNKASFEVILVDDASTDETAEIETFVSGITVVRNTQAQRFIRACNAGAAQARGKYVVLLNNDTEPTLGWLDALIDAFDRFPNVGLVGSKLLYPNGQLQDAGGIIWNTGNPWNYGNRQNPWDPRFTYARQADYLSGAALMTTRAIWDEVGGLSSYLEPMYFEDTDLPFKVREAGYSTWFVPASVVYHFEGMTSGTDVSTGFKKYQEVNRPKFKRRWASACTGFGQEGKMPDLEKDRGIVGRVLFIDYTTPQADKDAGSYAAIQEMKLVQSLGYKVTFLPENLAHLGAYTNDLERNGIEVITAPFYLSIPSFLEKRGAEFDAFYITRYYVGQSTMDKIRQVAPRSKILFNNADLHFLRQFRSALSNNDTEAMEIARKVRNEELEIILKADVTLSYNEIEHSVIMSHTEGAAKVVKCPWVVDLPPDVAPFETRRGISFLGGFKHYPNVDGIKWFASSVMPALDATLGKRGKRDKTAEPIELSIYGSAMGKDIKALKSDTILPVGFVENIADSYDRHRVFIAPLLSGAGIKGKVLSALAHGVPCVLSPVAAEGIGLRHGHDCLIAQTPDQWVTSIVQLYDDPKLWQHLSDNARAYVRDSFSFETGRNMMRAAFEAVEIFRSKD